MRPALHSIVIASWLGGCAQGECIEVQSTIHVGRLPDFEANCVVGDVLVRELERDGAAGLDGVETIYGSLAVEGSREPLSLESLESLRYVGGNVSFSGIAHPAELPSTWSLIEVGGTFSFVGNAGIREITGFERLEEIGDEMGILDNTDLFVVELPPGLEVAGLLLERNTGLREASFDLLTGAIEVRDQPQLERLEIRARVCDNCSSAVAGNPALVQLGITHDDPGGWVGIVDNDRLEHAAVVTAEQIRSLFLVANERLRTLSGLPEVTMVELIIIDDNDALSDLDFLGGLQIVGDAFIYSNAQLPAATVAEFVSRIAVTGRTKVAMNGPGSMPLDPCPFENDGFCDAPSAWFGEGTGICVEDPADCPESAD